MKPGVPWSVKGVEPEVRAAAKTAARRAGLTLGEWLNSMILDQSEHNADSFPAQSSYVQERSLTAPPPSSGPFRNEPPAMEDTSRSAARPRDESAVTLQDIAQQLADLAQKERHSAAIRPYEQPRRRMEEEEAFSRLLERVDDNERQTVEAFTAVNERLTVLGQQIATLPRGLSPDRPEDVPGYSALESALRNVIEHIEVSERRTRDSLKSMQDRLGEIATQAARQPQAEEWQRTGPAISGLEARVAELSNRLQRTESMVQSGIPETVRKELGQINERIETVRASADQLARQAQTSAAGVARSELHDVETRLLLALQEAQAQNAALPDIGHLRNEIGGLARRVDEIRTAAATERDLNALRIAVEQLSTRVAQGPDMRPLAEMDRRLGDLSRKFDQVAAGGNPLQLREFENRLYELGQRIETAVGAPGDSRAVEMLEQNIAAVGERVRRTEEQLRHIETMEQAIRQLYGSLEQGRSEATQTAEQAAARMVERMLASRAPSGPSPELRALEEGLRAVRESAAGADRRNQETLAAVHETLAQIVEKIADLEAARAPARQSPREEARRPEAETQIDLTPSQRAANLLNEGTVSPEAGGPPPLTEGDDFIAAARRAAQAAASRPSALRAEFGALTAMPEEEPRFSFLTRFRKRPKLDAPAKKAAPAPSQPEAAPKEASTATPAATAAATAKRRRLLLAGIVLLAAVSAFAFNMLVKKQDAVPPAAIEAPQGTGPDAAPQKQGRANLPADPMVTGSLTTASKADLAEMPPPETGPEALRRAAAQGDARAQFIIASRYLDGEGVRQDAAKAAHWYRLAAAGGLAPAQYRLATLFERGLGVPQDAKAALSWYEKAARQGNVRAMHNAAVLTIGGSAGPADYGKALGLFSRAADLGLADSQFNLAILIERGLGTRPDNREAYFWYRLAAQHGDAQAAARATALSKSFTAEQLSTLAQRIARWAPQPSDDGANVVSIADSSWRAPASSVLTSIAAEPLATPAAATPDLVTEAQQLLVRLGFNVGTPDGKMGQRTVNALREFQMQEGLEVTGEISDEVIEAMRAQAG